MNVGDDPINMDYLMIFDCWIGTGLDRSSFSIYTLCFWARPNCKTFSSFLDWKQPTSRQSTHVFCMFLQGHCRVFTSSYPTKTYKNCLISLKSRKSSILPMSTSQCLDGLDSWTVQQPKSTFILLVSPRKIVPRDPCRDSMLCVSSNSEKIVPKIASQPAQWFKKTNRPLKQRSAQLWQSCWMATSGGRGELNTDVQKESSRKNETWFQDHFHLQWLSTFLFPQGTFGGLQ